LEQGIAVLTKTGLLTKVSSHRDSNLISSVGFSPSGNNAAIVTGSGQVEIYDFLQSYTNEIELFKQDEASCMVWQSDNELVVGDSSGSIRFWDRRNKKAIKLDGFHDDRICGLSRSIDEVYIASGGNGSIVNVWDTRKLEKPLWTLRKHTSAVKAISWCPWAPSILATGGGIDDGMLHFHNTNTGVFVKSFDTGSQICDVVWSKHYKELITAQTSDDSQLVLWKYPSGEKAETLPGHSHRALNLAQSPDGETIASIGDDESLKFWNCFKAERGQKPLKFEKPPSFPLPTIR
jgi:cell division cycle 20, cofactor of APC complex